MQAFNFSLMSCSRPETCSGVIHLVYTDDDLLDAKKVEDSGVLARLALEHRHDHQDSCQVKAHPEYR